MVAASGAKEGLAPRIAAAMLAAVAVGLLLAIFIADRYSLNNRTPLDNPPEVLIARSKEILRNLGYPSPQTDAASGFAIDGYYPFWRLFLREFDVILYDERSHGRNPPHLASGHTQAQMAQDMETVLCEVAQRFGERRTAGVFHSLSSVVSLQHFLRYGMRFDALVLIDPPLAPPEGHPLHQRARNDELALHAWARRRQSRFGHPSELAEHFKRAQSLRRWLPGAAELMARSVTKPSPEGGCELVCPPAFEADTYLQNSNAPSWQALPGIAQDILVVSSDYNRPDADAPGQVCAAVASEFGIMLEDIAQSRRPLCIGCLDWSMRREHLGLAVLLEQRTKLVASDPVAAVHQRLG